jgi:small multidrug resistance pump
MDHPPRAPLSIWRKSLRGLLSRCGSARRERLRRSAAILSGYVYLGAAILSEVVATMSLRASEGFSKLGWVIPIVIGYCAAFVLLSFALSRGVPLGIAYAIWGAAGVAIVALLSVPFFGESLSVAQYFGLVLVIAGVIALELGATD